MEIIIKIRNYCMLISVIIHGIFTLFLPIYFGVLGNVKVMVISFISILGLIVFIKISKEDTDEIYYLRKELIKKQNKNGTD